MAQPWKTVRIFISSTFRDMHAERDYLVRFVFPELRERCAKRRLHLVDVDLRWGVTEDEAEQGKVLEVCLDEIERCRPFFVGLLGERYGWVPYKYDVPDEPFYDWVRQFEAGHSITAMEIYYGVLSDPVIQPRAFFYFRDPALLAALPAQHRATFLPESEEASEKLERLKEEIRQHYPVFENYGCIYAGVREDGQVLLTGLEALGQRVLDDLWSAINQEHPREETLPDALGIERAYHGAFIEGRSERFVGREDLLVRLADYADGEETTPLIISGAPGCGKSALLANFANQYAAAHTHTFVLAHFIGVSPGSTDIRRTLLRLCHELAQHFELTEEIPEDYYELRETLPVILEQSCSTSNVVLVLDGLNQLDEGDFAHELNWLPKELPLGLRLIVSTLEGDCLDTLRQWAPAPREIVVGPLLKDEQEEIVKQSLGLYRKHLDRNQMERLLRKRESASPLYLMVACEEMRVFGQFEHVTERVANLPDEIEGLFEQVLERLENDHGRELVEDALSLLECSRRGLLESEMLELLSREGEAQLPPVIWSRLYRSLQFYLRPSGENEEGSLDFFHRQLAKSVRRKYLAAEQAQLDVHTRLANYYWRKADPNHDGRWSMDYPRALSELPHHLLAGGLYHQLFQVARDESFLTAQGASFPGEPQVALGTVRAAIDGASEIDNAAAMADFVLTHARRVTHMSEESPLDALRRGSLGRAWKLADIYDIERSLLWYLMLVWELKDAGKMSQATATLQRLTEKELPRLSHWENVSSAVKARKHWQSRCAVALLAQAFEIDVDMCSVLSAKLFDEAALVELSSELIGRRQFAAALATAGHITHAFYRSNVPSAIAVAQAQAGEFSAALAVAEAIEDDYDRTNALREIGIAEAQAGDIDAALRTAQQVTRWDMPGILCAIAISQARSKDYASALKTAQEIDDPEVKVEAMRGIAVIQAEAKDFWEAMATIGEQIDDTKHKAKALCAIAVALAKVGLGGTARGTFAEAFETALQIDLRERAEVLMPILELQARSGDSHEAIETARRFRDPYDRAAMLSMIAAAEVQIGSTSQAQDAFTEALTTAQMVEPVEDQRRLLQEINTAQAKSGDFAVTLTLAPSQESPVFRASFLNEMAGLQAKCGRREVAQRTFEEAVSTAKQIDNTYFRASSLLQIAMTQAQAEAEESSRETFAAALEAGRQVTPTEDGRRILCSIAVAQVQVGDSLSAREAFREILALELDRDCVPVWTEALRDIGAAQAEAGDLGAALETVSRSKAVSEKAKVLCAIAVAQAQIGNINGAVVVAQLIDIAYREAAMALSPLPGTKIPSNVAAFGVFVSISGTRTEVLRGIASAQTRVGDYAAALETAAEINDPRDRTKILCAIAVAQAEIGDGAASRATLDAASETTRQISDPMRYWALREIGEAQAQCGDAAAAVELVEQLDDEYQKILVMCAIAVSQAKQGDPTAARETLVNALYATSGSSDSSHRLDALQRIAAAQAQTGDIAGAFATVLEVSNTLEWVEALGAIAAAQARAGDSAAAFETEKRAGPEEWKSKIRCAIAVAQARSNFALEAVRTAQSILCERCKHLIEVSEALVTAVHREAFKKMMIPCAYYSDSAYRICGLLARLYPEQATAVAAVVCRDEIENKTEEVSDKRVSTLQSVTSTRHAGTSNSYTGEPRGWKSLPWWKRLIGKNWK